MGEYTEGGRVRTSRTKHIPHAGNAPNLDKRRAATALYRDGLSLSQIGAALGVSKQAIHQLLRRAGVIVRREH